MKKGSYFLVLLVVVFSSCKFFAKSATKYWTKKQVKEFVSNCESKASPFVGESKAKDYCECAVKTVSEEYQNFEEMEKVSIRSIMRLAKACE